MITEFPSGGKLAQKSIMPSEVNKDMEVPDLHQDSTTTSAPPIGAEPPARQLTENHEAP